MLSHSRVLDEQRRQQALAFIHQTCAASPTDSQFMAGGDLEGPLGGAEDHRLTS